MLIQPLLGVAVMLLATLFGVSSIANNFHNSLADFSVNPNMEHRLVKIPSSVKIIPYEQKVRGLAEKFPRLADSFEAKRTDFNGDGVSVLYHAQGTLQNLIEFYQKETKKYGWFRVSDDPIVFTNRKKIAIRVEAKPSSDQALIVRYDLGRLQSAVLGESTIREGVFLAQADGGTMPPSSNGSYPPPPSSGTAYTPPPESAYPNQQYTPPPDSQRQYQNQNGQYQPGQYPPPSGEPYPNQQYPSGTYPPGPYPNNTIQPYSGQQQYQKEQYPGKEGSFNQGTPLGKDQMMENGQGSGKDQMMRGQPGIQQGFGGPQGFPGGPEGQEGSQEEMEKQMQQQMLAEMKRHITDFVRQIKSMRQRIGPMEKQFKACGAGLPEELKNSLASVDELVKKVQGAQTEDEAFQAMEALQDASGVFQELGPQMGDLMRLCPLIKQADQRVKQFEREVTRLESRVKAQKKIDASDLLGELKVGFTEIKTAFAKARELAKTNPEEALDTLEDEVFGKLDNIQQDQGSILMILNISSELPKRERELKSLERKIQNLSKRGDTSQTKALLDELKIKITALKELIKSKPDVETLRNVVEELFDLWEQLTDAIQQLGGSAEFVPQVKGGQGFEFKAPQGFMQSKNPTGNTRTAEGSAGFPSPRFPSESEHSLQ